MPTDRHVIPCIVLTLTATNQAVLTKGTSKTFHLCSSPPRVPPTVPISFHTRITLGRGRDVTWELPQIDISKQHAQIGEASHKPRGVKARVTPNHGVPTNGSKSPVKWLYLMDLGSVNGTFVNGQRLSPARTISSDVIWLQHGDIIQLGDLMLCVSMIQKNVTIEMECEEGETHDHEEEEEHKTNIDPDELAKTIAIRKQQIQKRLAAQTCSNIIPQSSHHMGDQTITSPEATKREAHLRQAALAAIKRKQSQSKQQQQQQQQHRQQQSLSPRRNHSLNKQIDAYTPPHGTHHLDISQHKRKTRSHSRSRSRSRSRSDSVKHVKHKKNKKSSKHSHSHSHSPSPQRHHYDHRSSSSSHHHHHHHHDHEHSRSRSRSISPRHHSRLRSSSHHSHSHSHSHRSHSRSLSPHHHHHHYHKDSVSHSRSSYPHQSHDDLTRPTSAGISTSHVTHSSRRRSGSGSGSGPDTAHPSSHTLHEMTHEPHHGAPHYDDISEPEDTESESESEHEHEWWTTHGLSAMPPPTHTNTTGVEAKQHAQHTLDTRHPEESYDITIDV